ncbi:MAG: hypothetical protein WCZ98_06985 [Sideroxydans sp.]
MKYPKINIFAAWFFMVNTLFMGWVTKTGEILLQLLGVPAVEGDVPSRMVGTLLLFAAVFAVLHFRSSLPPGGMPGEKDYLFGHRLVLIGNMLALSLFVFQMFATTISDYNTHLVLNKFTTAFGYLCMGFFAVGFSLIYQSSMRLQEKKN